MARATTRSWSSSSMPLTPPADVPWADLILLKADAHAALGDENDLIGSAGELGLDENIAGLDGDGDDAALPDVAEFIEGGLLDRTFLGGEEEVTGLLPGDVFAIGSELGLDANHRRDLLVGAELEEIGDTAAFGGSRHVWDLMDALDVDAAEVGEEHEVVVSAGGEEMLDENRALRPRHWTTRGWPCR